MLQATAAGASIWRFYLALLSGAFIWRFHLALSSGNRRPFFG
jgi:hypothetical protein